MQNKIIIEKQNIFEVRGGDLNKQAIFSKQTIF
jgi:hypothetical protein